MDCDKGFEKNKFRIGMKDDDIQVRSRKLHVKRNAHRQYVRERRRAKSALQETKRTKPDFRQISRNLPKRRSRGFRMKVENRERKQGENGFARTYS